jgi:hypothetical protein
MPSNRFSMKSLAEISLKKEFSSSAPKPFLVARSAEMTLLEELARRMPTRFPLILLSFIVDSTVLQK